MPIILIITIGSRIKNKRRTIHFNREQISMKLFGLILFVLLLTAAVQAQTKKIVFVCEHGSAKSTIAAAYFNKLAKEKNLPWEAISRGTNPDKEVSPKTKKLLVQDNLFDEKFVPQILSQVDVDEADQVILFYPLPETIQAKSKVQDWQQIQSVNDDFEKLKNDILGKINPLLDSLTRQ